MYRSPFDGVSSTSPFSSHVASRQLPLASGDGYARVLLALAHGQGGGGTVKHRVAADARLPLTGSESTPSVSTTNS